MSTQDGNFDSPEGLRGRTPRERVMALADPGTAVFDDAPRPSPHLARFGIAAAADDGLVLARARLFGRPVLFAAQDERFLRGSVGARHGEALAAWLSHAATERPEAVLLLLASGGVRLHEANAAELALGRALTRLLELRAGGVPVIALAVADVFGGTSVLACAVDRLALLPEARIGVSGPKVIESVHGKWELDADDADEVRSIFGAAARATLGAADLVADDGGTLRAWLATAIVPSRPFDAQVLATQARLDRRLLQRANLPRFVPPPPFAAAVPLDAPGWLWRQDDVVIARAIAPASFGAAEAHALDAALLAEFAPAGAAARTLVLCEDSPGHAVSRAAEMLFVSEYLAQHAAVLALIARRGHRVVGWLTGTGHSAAFFVNALQGGECYALPTARVVAMEPAALARVTGLPAATLVDDDPLLGQPVRFFAALGGITAVTDAAGFAAALRKRD